MEITCLVSAITFFLANLISMSANWANTKLLQSNWDRALFRSLDGKYLWQWWYHRDTLSGGVIFGGFLCAISWVLLAIPIAQVAYAASKGGKRMLWLHVSMVCLAFAGCTTEFIARLLDVGVWSSCRWIAGSFELKNWMNEDENDYTGFKVLEIVYQVAGGTTMWMDSFEYIALFGIFSLNFWSFRSLNTDQRHPLIYGFSLALAVSCFCDGVFLIMRFQNWGLFTFLANTFTVVNRLILIPVWLLIMARWLPTALQVASEEQKSSLASNEGDLTIDAVYP
jgi:hypothetical protein